MKVILFFWSFNIFGVINMGSFGDSITAASLANYSLGETYIDPNDTVARGAIIPQLKMMFSNFNLSWSTGDDIQSLKQYLHSSTKQKVNGYNFAVPGDKTSDLIMRIRDAYNNGELKKLDVMTLMIGPNNLCKEDYVNDPIKAANQLRHSINTLMQVNQAPLYFTDIPEIHQLYKFRNEPSILGYSCSDIWDLSFFYCHRLLGNANSTKIKWVKEQVDEFNHQWDLVANEMKNQWGSRIHYLPIYRNKVFKKEELSIDCFHPSAKGQQSISNYFTSAMYNGF